VLILNKIIAVGGRMGKNNDYLLNSSLFARYKNARIIKYIYPSSKKNSVLWVHIYLKKHI